MVILAIVPEARKLGKWDGGKKGLLGTFVFFFVHVFYVILSMLGIYDQSSIYFLLPKKKTIFLF
jgi:hypothetical protein